jgi:erythronate-4-phosphate dehydrogenase
MADLNSLRWVVDEAIPHTACLRQIMGEVVSLSGRDITPQAIQRADVLLVRSITQVNEALLAGSRVRFVGTATAGHDHIDTQSLARLGVEWCAAPESNAVSVVEYVLSAVALSGFLKAILEGLPVGIVGLGAVGARLARRLTQLGCTVVGYDPLQKNWPSEVVPAELDEVLCQPVVSLHAALHDGGQYPSRDLINPARAERMASAAEDRPDGGLLINAARGSLITPQALEMLLASRLNVVLDTWPGEPELSGSVLQSVDWISPHIAGHSITAKHRASDMLAEAVARWLRIEIERETADDRTPSLIARLPGMETGQGDPLNWLQAFLVDMGTLQYEDRRLRAVASPHLSSGTFDQLRSSYSQPSEWSGQTFTMQGMSQPIAAMAERLGINVISREEAFQ